MAKKHLADLYTSVLKSVGLGVDEHGATYTMEGDQQVPFTMKGKVLNVPTDSFLKDPDFEKFQPFHPLCENIQRNKSEVLERLTKLAEMHINNALTELILAMVDFAAKKENHKKANTEQKKFLRLWDTAREDTLKAVKDLLIKGVDITTDKTLCTIFIRRDGMWKGEQWPRLAVVAFPIMDEEVSAQNNVVYGKKLPRVSDKVAFFSLLRHILPGIDDPDAYNYGSKSPTAPNFHALMMAYNSVFKDLNQQLRLFESLYPSLSTWITDLTWVKELSELSDYKHQIPPLPGNEGTAVQGDLVEENRQVTERKEREVRAEKRDAYRRGGSRYGTDEDAAPEDEPGWRSRGRRGRDEPRRSSRYRDRDRDYDDRDSRDSGRPTAGWRQRTARRDDRDYDLDRRERRDYRDRDDDGRTASGISTSFGEPDPDARRGGYSSNRYGRR